MRVVVIGGVAAGMSAASKLKRNLGNDVQITVYEKGGDVSYGACGIPFYVSGRIQRAETLIVRGVEQFRESGIEVCLFHEVLAVDTAEKRVTVKDMITGNVFSQPYDKLIIASGATSKRIQALGTGKTNLVYVRNLNDAKALRTALEQDGVRNIVIIGAGLIGLEMTDACKQYGKEITLVEAAPQVLPSMDSEFSQMLVQELVGQGVSIKVDCTVKGAQSDGAQITGVIVAHDGVEETIPADLVIGCIGIEPCTGFISGLDRLDNGAIKVNGNMEATVPDIYAAGDCSVMRSFVTGRWSYMPLGTNANKQGRIIANVIGGKKVPAFKPIRSTAIRLFHLDVAMVGINEREAGDLGLSYRTSFVTGNSFASYYDDKKVKIKLVYEADTHKLLGAQLAGQGTVVPRANYFAIAMANEMTADEFGFLDLCYSPPFSGVWDAALIAANTCK
ncbi:MAG: FAD-dependent oxidoreductase [Oscillospiraceae bacterium]|nr:FAD-dependent oxidoreductase [Oscillospiraceae bacterium]